jgi:hypothetical protein
MNPRPKRLGIAIVCALSLSNASAPIAQRRVTRRPRRQTEFSMDEKIRPRLKVPRYVIAQMVRSERQDDRTISADEVADGAVGAPVNLNDDGREDLLVRADPGANITGFWLFRNTGRRWEIVLYTVALGVTIKRTRTNGFHDVEVVAASAVTGWEALYKFDGARYKPAGCWEHDLGVGKNGEWGPARRIACSGGDVKAYR